MTAQIRIKRCLEREVLDTDGCGGGLPADTQYVERAVRRTRRPAQANVVGKCLGQRPQVLGMYVFRPARVDCRTELRHCVRSPLLVQQLDGCRLASQPFIWYTAQAK